MQGFMRAAFTKEVDFFARAGVEYVDTSLSFTEPNLLKRTLFETWGPRLGITEDESDWAAEQGLKALDDFNDELQRRGQEILDQVEREGRMAILVTGRPYHSDPGLNQADAVVLIDGQHRVALAPQILHEGRHPHVVPLVAGIRAHVPDGVVKDHHSERLHVRREQIPVPLHALVGMVAVDEQHVDGPLPVPGGGIREGADGLHVLLHPERLQVGLHHGVRVLGLLVVPVGAGVGVDGVQLAAALVLQGQADVARRHAPGRADLDADLRVDGAGGGELR